MTQRLTSENIFGSVTCISWSIVFAFHHCHILKLFVYIKKWHGPEVFVPFRVLALGAECKHQLISKINNIMNQTPLN